MNKILLACLILLPTLGQAQSSDDDSTPEEPLRFIDRLYTGGDLSLNFGTYSFVYLAPMLGYNLFGDELSVGVGGRYMYARDGVYDLNYHMYGGSGFARYLIGDVVILHAEYERLNVEFYSALRGELTRDWIDVPLVGGGYRQNFGRGSYMQFLILYDLNNDYRSPYTTAFDIPITFRGGFVFKITDRY